MGKSGGQYKHSARWESTRYSVYTNTGPASNVAEISVYVEARFNRFEVAECCGLMLSAVLPGVAVFIHDLRDRDAVLPYYEMGEKVER